MGSSNVILRSLPAVDKVLAALADLPVPSAVLTPRVRAALDGLRAQSWERTEPWDADEVTASIRRDAEALAASRLRPVINATGVLIHTNLGRSPASARALAHLMATAGGYCNVEFDLESGKRGPRAGYAEACLAALCEAEAATMVNNCAAALFLILRIHLGGDRREVIVSRGELVEIGGGFRIPEILETSGAVLREVGTTNKTGIEDYARAITPATALILKVHRSNFHIEGFTSEVGLAELANLAHDHGLPLVHDLGSGAVMATDQLAPIDHEPTPMESLASGADLVCFSGDKLLGGPQAGILAGRADLVAAAKKDPFFRAVRCDKVILTLVQETVTDYLASRDGKTPEVPVLRFLAEPVETLRQRAESIAGTVNATVGAARVEVAAAVSRTGGGTMPTSAIPSVALVLRPRDGGPRPDSLAARLRRHEPPVLGYVEDGALHLNLRTVFPPQDETLARALAQALV